MVYLNRLIVGLAALIGLVVPAAFADDLDKALEALRQEMPSNSELLRSPGAEGWSIYGQRNPPKMTSSRGAHGGKAIAVSLKRAGGTPFDVGAQMANQAGIGENHMIFAQIWLRAEKVPAGQSQASLPLLLQESSEPYASFARSEANVTEEWLPYNIFGRTERAYKEDEIALTVHLSGAAQDIELGSVFLLDLGPGEVDTSLFPISGGGPRMPAAPTASSSTLTLNQNQLQMPIQPLETALRTDLTHLQARLPIAGTLISNPAVMSWAGRGEGHNGQIISASIPGGRAIRLDTPKPQINAWDNGASSNLPGSIRQGDTVFMAFYARADQVNNESQTGIISAVGVELAGAPYTSVVKTAAKVSKTWDMYYVSGKAIRDYAPGEAQVTLHLGAVKQGLEFGPVYVLNMGQNIDPRSLPRNEITYEGREQDAPWRTAALSRIEQHRKGDLVVKVTDRNGNPIEGASVSADMTRHAFMFGSFTNYNYGPGKSVDNDRLDSEFDTLFNSATVPIYWADWGWENSARQKRFKDTVQHVSKTGLPFRAHPVIWPGEKHLPSAVLAMEPGSKEQRKAVLDHVREVVSFLKPYGPVAIDVSNEPRVNNYFKDNGDPGLVYDAFRLAHSIMPETPLFINDYSILNGGGVNQSSIDFYKDWLRDAQRNNVPVGGIGFQSHFSAGLTPPQRVYDILEEFSQFNLPMQITEFDIETLDEAVQADYTRDFLMATFSHPGVDAFIAWGYWEGDHWKADAAMMRKDFSKKPNYQAWMDTIYRDFWTRTSAVTGPDGTAILRGFHGDYDVRVNGGPVQKALLPKGGTMIEIKG